MAKSITVRNGRGSHRHNVRDYKQMPKHIHEDKIKDNEILVDIPLWRFYRQTFQPVIDEFNAKQKRADRRLPDAMAYLNKIKSETGDMARKPYYETFVQIGDRDSTGLHDCEVEREILREFALNWESRNPNMKLIGAYIHADESTLHLHVDWVPVADGYKRGMPVQNGLKRALKQMGFDSKSKKYNGYLDWQESEREALRQMCRDRGIEPAESKAEHREWLDKETYILREQLNEKQQELNTALDKVGKLTSHIDAQERYISVLSNDIQDLEENYGKALDTLMDEYNRFDTIISEEILYQLEELRKRTKSLADRVEKIRQENQNKSSGGRSYPEHREPER